MVREQMDEVDIQQPLPGEVETFARSCLTSILAEMCR
jgi:hypothetical protein